MTFLSFLFAMLTPCHGAPGGCARTAFIKLQIIDDINQEQRNSAFVQHALVIHYG